MSIQWFEGMPKGLVFLLGLGLGAVMGSYVLPPRVLTGGKKE